MRIHHLNCGTIHANSPYPGVTHCLLLETGDGLALVDTGFGTRDYNHPSRHVRWFMRVNAIPRDPEQTAVRQIVSLGYDPHDVRHIILTHLHLDHAAGMLDFPWAQVHAHRSEFEAVLKRRKFSLKEQVGYATEHVGRMGWWTLHAPARKETWFGLPCARIIPDDKPIVRMIPLPGHSRGHCGIAVRDGERWLLHCGDAYVRDMQVDPDNPKDPFPPFMRPASRMLFPDAALQTLRVLRRDHGDEITMFCSHNPLAYAALRGTSVDEAVGRSRRPDA